MKDVVIAKKGNYPVELEAGKTYWFCACGRSSNQPFCNGAHQSTDITPMKFEVEKTKTYALCGCKHSKNMPFCDGTHKTL